MAAIYNHYVTPVVNHPVPQNIYQFGKKVVVEVGSCTIVVLFLQTISNQLQQMTTNKQIRSHIFLAVMIAPIIEEILFRGIVQHGIWGGQVVMNRVSVKWLGHEVPTSERLKAQEVFRVRVTAVLFGAVHIFNHATLAPALIQFTIAGLAGLPLGYLTEKHQTLSLSILAHGLHNTFVSLPQAAVNHLDEPLALVAGLTMCVANGTFWWMATHDYFELPTFEKVGQKVKGAYQWATGAQPRPLTA